MTRFPGKLIIATAKNQNAILSCTDSLPPRPLLQDRTFKCDLRSLPAKRLFLLDRFYRKSGDGKEPLMIETRLVHADGGKTISAIARRYEHSLRYPFTADVDSSGSRIVYLNERAEVCEAILGKKRPRLLYQNIAPGKEHERVATYGPKYSAHADYVAFMMFEDADDPSLEVVSTKNFRKSPVPSIAVEEFIWSPDNEHIAVCCFAEYDEGRNHLRILNVNTQSEYEIPFPTIRLPSVGAASDTKDKRRIRHLAWSPDRTKIAGVMDSGSGESIWIVDVPSKTWNRATDMHGCCWNVCWSPDGSHLAFLAATQKRTQGVRSHASWLQESGTTAAPGGELFLLRVGQRASSTLQSVPKSLEFAWI